MRWKNKEKEWALAGLGWLQKEQVWERVEELLAVLNVKYLASFPHWCQASRCVQILSGHTLVFNDKVLNGLRLSWRGDWQHLLTFFPLSFPYPACFSLNLTWDVIPQHCAANHLSTGPLTTWQQSWNGKDQTLALDICMGASGLQTSCLFWAYSFWPMSTFQYKARRKKKLQHFPRPDLS